LLPAMWLLQARTYGNFTQVGESSPWFRCPVASRPSASVSGQPAFSRQLILQIFETEIQPMPWKERDEAPSLLLHFSTSMAPASCASSWRWAAGQMIWPALHPPFPLLLPFCTPLIPVTPGAISDRRVCMMVCIMCSLAVSPSVGSGSLSAVCGRYLRPVTCLWTGVWSVCGVE
jgi:hypothetical protein